MTEVKNYILLFINGSISFEEFESVAIYRIIRSTFSKNQDDPTFTNTTLSHFVRYASTNNTTAYTPDQQSSGNVVFKIARAICDYFVGIPRTFTTVIHIYIIY